MAAPPAFANVTLADADEARQTMLSS